MCGVLRLPVHRMLRGLVICYRRGSGRSVFADPAGNIVGERRLEGTWFELFERFHSNLLIRNGGRWYNGVAGLALAVLSLAGFYLWWPSRGQWGNAFRIVRTSNWKGLIYDLHRVGGAVTLVFTLLFCITGAYFTWPAVYRNLIAAVLPVKQKATVPPVSVHGRASTARYACCCGQEGRWGWRACSCRRTSGSAPASARGISTWHGGRELQDQPSSTRSGHRQGVGRRRVFGSKSW